jgi:LysR family transcriptional regulator (chromosome initiation inhibitor)
MLVRGKTVRATPAGQVLLAHVEQLRMMESDLLGGPQTGRLPGTPGTHGTICCWTWLLKTRTTPMRR